MCSTGHEHNFTVYDKDTRNRPLYRLNFSIDLMERLQGLFHIVDQPHSYDCLTNVQSVPCFVKYVIQFLELVGRKFAHGILVEMFAHMMQCGLDLIAVLFENSDLAW